MKKIFRCQECGNVTYFDEAGDGRCTDCGEIMENTSEDKLSDEDKKTLAEEADKVDELDKTTDLATDGKDILDKK